MDRFHVICVDDQTDILFQLVHDLAPLAKWVNIKPCSDAQSAQAWLEKIDSEGNYPCVVVSDHNMPGQNGVDWLQTVSLDRRFRHTKKVMLSKTPTNEMLIEAINKAYVDRFFAKPWDKDELLHQVRVLLTEYIFDKGIDYAPLQKNLDPETVFKYLQDVTF
ncbi:MAG: two-component system response regulator [Vibrio sp.]